MKIIKDKALYFLAKRDYSRVELKQKLRLKGFSVEDIGTVLDELEAENLLNEERFVASYIRTRVAKGYGPLKLCVELGKHNIEDERIYTSDEWQHICWQEIAVRVRIKRFGNVIPKAVADQIKQMRFLQQRGFTSEQIRYALKAL